MIRLLLIFILINGCQNNQTNYNPFIPDIDFERVININLPVYDDLKFNGGSVKIDGIAVCGIILFNFNNDIIAWESCDPNHKKINSCPSLTVEGVQAKCICENNLYSLATGQILNEFSSNYPLIRYMTERIGNTIRIYN